MPKCFQIATNPTLEQNRYTPLIHFIWVQFNMFHFDKPVSYHSRPDHDTGFIRFPHSRTFTSLITDPHPNLVDEQLRNDQMDPSLSLGRWHYPGSYCDRIKVR